MYARVRGFDVAECVECAQSLRTSLNAQRRTPRMRPSDQSASAATLAVHEGMGVFPASTSLGGDSSSSPVVMRGDMWLLSANEHVDFAVVFTPHDAGRSSDDVDRAVLCVHAKWPRPVGTGTHTGSDDSTTVLSDTHIDLCGRGATFGLVEQLPERLELGVVCAGASKRHCVSVTNAANEPQEVHLSLRTKDGVVPRTPGVVRVGMLEFRLAASRLLLAPAHYDLDDTRRTALEEAGDAETTTALSPSGTVEIVCRMLLPSEADQLLGAYAPAHRGAGEADVDLQRHVAARHADHGTSLIRVSSWGSPGSPAIVTPPPDAPSSSLQLSRGRDRTLRRQGSNRLHSPTATVPSPRSWALVPSATQAITHGIVDHDTASDGGMGTNPAARRLHTGAAPHELVPSESDIRRLFEALHIPTADQHVVASHHDDGSQDGDPAPDLLGDGDAVALFNAHCMEASAQLVARFPGGRSVTTHLHLTGALRNMLQEEAQAAADMRRRWMSGGAPSGSDGPSPQMPPQPLWSVVDATGDVGNRMLGVQVLDVSRGGLEFGTVSTGHVVARTFRLRSRVSFAIPATLVCPRAYFTVPQARHVVLRPHADTTVTVHFVSNQEYETKHDAAPHSHPAAFQVSHEHAIAPSTVPPRLTHAESFLGIGDTTMIDPMHLGGGSVIDGVNVTPHLIVRLLHGVVPPLIIPLHATARHQLIDANALTALDFGHVVVGGTATLPLRLVATTAMTDVRYSLTFGAQPKPRKLSAASLASEGAATAHDAGGGEEDTPTFLCPGGEDGVLLRYNRNAKDIDVVFRPSTAGWHTSSLFIAAVPTRASMAISSDMDAIHAGGELVRCDISGVGTVPSLRVHLATLDFGVIGVDLVTIGTFMVTNTCQAPFRVSASSVLDSDAQVWLAEPDTDNEGGASEDASPRRPDNVRSDATEYQPLLLPSSPTSITVHIKPHCLGAISGSLTLRCADVLAGGAELASVDLAAEVARVNLRFEHTSDTGKPVLDVGRVAVGNDVPYPVALRNTGPVAVTTLWSVEAIPSADCFAAPGVALNSTQGQHQHLYPPDLCIEQPWGSVRLGSRALVLEPGASAINVVHMTPRRSGRYQFRIVVRLGGYDASHVWYLPVRASGDSLSAQWKNQVCVVSSHHAVWAAQTCVLVDRHVHACVCVCMCFSCLVCSCRNCSTMPPSGLCWHQLGRA